MTNYNAPLTFEQKVNVVLEGIFLNEYMREDIQNEIIDDVRHHIELHKMTTDISSIQTAVCWVFYHKLITNK